jgi:hypothetical protein
MQASDPLVPNILITPAQTSIFGGALSLFNANPGQEISWVGEKFLWANASARFSLPYPLAH